MTLDQALALLGMLTDTVQSQQQQIVSLQMQLNEQVNAVPMKFEEE